MFTVTIANGKTFTAAEGESLLDAALRQHITLDYSCRTGRCSTCRSRVSPGTTVPLRDETGLSAAEQAEGYVLTCVRGACSDVLLDIEDLGDVTLPDPKTVPCRIHALDKLSHDVVRVVLRTPPATPLAFLPGQYIDVIGAAGLRRSYSVANAPQEDHLIELHIREVPDGQMSQYWFRDAKLNDLLRLRGPLGTFFLRGYADRDLIFLATGTGIAPVKAMLEGWPGPTPPASRDPSAFTGADVSLPTFTGGLKKMPGWMRCANACVSSRCCRAREAIGTVPGAMSSPR